LGVLMGLLAGGLVLLVSSAPRGEAIRLLPPPTAPPLTVHVDGAVVQPGVYELPQGSRIQNAIQAAGGVLPEADLQALNLAALLEDGATIRVPERGSAPSLSESTRGGEIAVDPGGLIDINTATQEALESLPGIGPTLAQRVIEYRQANGPFPSIEAIQNVPGIGPGIFEKIKGLITVK
jgi:competence protein ComEA